MAAGWCGQYDDLKKRLIQTGEARAGYGISSAGHAVVELWVNQDGTFSVLTRRSDGRACLQAWGQNWTPVKLIWGKPT